MEEGSQWIHSSRLNGARDDHRMIAFNDNLYVFGGWRDGGAHGSTEKYTPDKGWAVVTGQFDGLEVSVTCVASYPGSETIYQVGGYCPK